MNETASQLNIAKQSASSVKVEMTEEQRLGFEKATSKANEVKEQIDTLIDQFFGDKMEQVKQNEQMIVDFKYKSKITDATNRLKFI